MKSVQVREGSKKKKASAPCLWPVSVLGKTIFDESIIIPGRLRAACNSNTCMKIQVQENGRVWRGEEEVRLGYRGRVGEKQHSVILS